MISTNTKTIHLPELTLCMQASDCAESTNEHSPRREIAISIFPNPAKHSFQLKCNTALSGKVNIIIYDAMGRPISEYTYNDFSSAQFSTSILTNGLYLLKLKTADGKSICKKFLVEK